MHPHDALKALRAVGVDAHVVNARRFRADGRELEVAFTRPAPTRSDAERALASAAAGSRVLLLADRMTPSLRQAALDDARIVVVTGGSVIWDRQSRGWGEEQNPASTHSPGRRPYGRFAVARALLAGGPSVTQQQLAERAGISQGSVSKALTARLFDGVLDRTRGEVGVIERAMLFDRAIGEYPGPGGVTTYWWHEASVMQQTESILAVDGTALASGDIAADGISAWRRPEHAVVYTQAAPELRRLGFVLSDRDDYTLMLGHPEDQTIWSTARTWSTARRTDPITAAYDVARTGTLGDHHEAVDRIKRYVIGGDDD